jgi:hypothetical protein
MDIEELASYGSAHFTPETGTGARALIANPEMIKSQLRVTT